VKWKFPIDRFLWKIHWRLLLLLTISLEASPTFQFPVSFWYKQGFSLTESVEISKQGQKDPIFFSDWLDQQTEIKRKKVLAILIANRVKLKKSPSKKINDSNTSNLNSSRSKEGTRIQSGNSDFGFLSGTYQILDTRYLPMEMRNHSSLLVGGTFNYGKAIFEKRDTEFTYGTELNYRYLHIFSGQRYKPLPNFYFAKDPNFFSNFDRKDSYLPQPLNESYFAGVNFNPTGTSHMIGIYSAKSVSPEPGLYFVSPNKSYSITIAPHTKIGSLYINDSFKNFLLRSWNTNLQGEGIGKVENYVGFFYLRSVSEELKLKIDITTYRDNQFISLPTSDFEGKNGIKQDLGYIRFRYKEYFVMEGLNSKEGLRYESGYGLQVPFLYGDWGALVMRFRNYSEEGFYHVSAGGRGLFYEFRNQKTIFSLGSEIRDRHYQWEGKVSVPLNNMYFLELSCLYREAGIPMRSWFENWSYATDFNMNLVDRREIWKLKFVGPDLSLNLSISEKSDSQTFIYYANFQFNHRF